MLKKLFLCVLLVYALVHRVPSDTRSVCQGLRTGFSDGYDCHMDVGN